MNIPEKLFEPITIGNMELNNRIVMAPLGIGLPLLLKTDR